MTLTAIRETRGGISKRNKHEWIGEHRILPRDVQRQNHYRTKFSEMVPLCQSRVNLSNGSVCEKSPRSRRNPAKDAVSLTKQNRLERAPRYLRSAKRILRIKDLRERGRSTSRSREKKVQLQQRRAALTTWTTRGVRPGLASFLLNGRFCIVSFPSESPRRETCDRCDLVDYSLSHLSPGKRSDIFYVLFLSES